MNNKISLPPISDILNNHPSRPYLPPTGAHYLPMFPAPGSGNVSSNPGLPQSQFTYPQSKYQYHQQLPPQVHVQPPQPQPQTHQAPHFYPLNPISQKSRSSSASSDSSNYHYQSNLRLYKLNSNDGGLPLGTTPSKSPIYGKPGYSPNMEGSSPSSPDGSDKRKVRNNLPKETTYILLKWLNDHLNHPYPNSFEKNQLMLSTGLNQQQLSNWFINARRRKIKVLKEQQRLNV